MMIRIFTGLLAGCAMLGSATAHAQDAEAAVPPVEVVPDAAIETADRDAKPDEREPRDSMTLGKAFRDLPRAVDADPALWVVEDADTTVYLFGTVHLLKPGLSWFDEAVKNAFEKSDTLVLELVEPEPAEAQAIVGRIAVNPDGPSLRDKLSPEARTKYEAALTSLGIPSPTFDRFDPWFVAVNLSVIALQKAGFDPNSGAERTLAAVAKRGNKPIAGLETTEQQFGFFDNLPEKNQIDFLNYTVETLADAEEGLDSMVDLWARGRPDELADLLSAGLTDPLVFDTLLTNRNAQWARWVATRLEKPGTVFVAVGSGHLAGVTSVQHMLSAYNIVPKRVAY